MVTTENEEKISHRGRKMISYLVLRLRKRNTVEFHLDKSNTMPFHTALLLVSLELKNTTAAVTLEKSDCRQRRLSRGIMGNLWCSNFKLILVPQGLIIKML